MPSESGDCFTVGEAMIRETLPGRFELSKIINGPCSLTHRANCGAFSTVVPEYVHPYAIQINPTAFVFLSSIQRVLVGYGIGSYRAPCTNPNGAHNKLDASGGGVFRN
jgi:hypothetical protein